MAKAQRKAIARLAARTSGTQDYSGRSMPLAFGMVMDTNGKSQMLHKPGSQNRNK